MSGSNAAPNERVIYGVFPNLPGEEIGSLQLGESVRGIPPAAIIGRRIALPKTASTAAAFEDARGARARPLPRVPLHDE